MNIYTILQLVVGLFVAIFLNIWWGLFSLILTSLILIGVDHYYYKVPYSQIAKYFEPMYYSLVLVCLSFKPWIGILGFFYYLICDELTRSLYKAIQKIGV